ncbi:DUF3014 domain-containing protein [Neptunicella sp. SCSIO 80796]|uniref:DUF3014 domain-containing protein n=1 Tax=Neptunicella plasticusilytica TaxID=3117012 RepID=UPI003A4DE572
MTDDINSTSRRSMLPYLFVAALLVILVAALYLWNTDKEPEQPVVSEPVTLPEPKPVQPETVEPEPEPQDIVEQPAPDTEDMGEPENIEPEPPKPVDIKDSTIKQLITETSDYEALPQVMVNNDLLERFVVFTDNLANHEIANSHRLLNPPKQKFKVYQQADRQWIDTSSYKRYSLYTDIFTSMDSEKLVELFEIYLPAMTEKYAEVGSTRQPFATVVEEAIEHLLNTPEVPTPIEVTTDSVMYKYVDPRLEALSPVQKQLLRTGPENMRLIKAKLRDIKALLNQTE